MNSEEFKKHDGDRKDGTAASSMLTPAPFIANAEPPPAEQVMSTVEPASSVHQPATTTACGPPPRTVSATQLVTSDAVSSTSSNLPEQLWNQAYNIKGNKPGLSSASEIATGMKKGKTVLGRSTASNSRMRSHHEDGSPGRNPPNDGESDIAQSRCSAYNTLLLERGTPSVRLITILPSEKDDSPVSCDLNVVNLEDDPQYTALSYVWGSTTNLTTVTVNGFPLTVTENLGAALRGIRKVWGRITLWIDAICINQSDSEEKARQIPMMGKIYRGAEKVISWLGDDSAFAKVFKEARGRLEENNTVAGISIEDIHLGLPNTLLGNHILMLRMALNYLNTSNYWKRTWIVQEVILARVLILQCDISTMNWDLISNYILAEDRRNGNYYSACVETGYIREPSALKMLAAARDYWHKEPNHDIFSVITRYIGQEATDPRDKIWGFLGISNDGDRLTVVDPTLKVDEVYLSFAQIYIREYQSLQILQAAGRGLSRQDNALCLPSWVPDWRTRASHGPGSLEAPFDSQGKLYSAAKSIPAKASISACGRILNTQGILFDIVTQVKDSKWTPGTAPHHLEWITRTLKLPSLSTDYINGEPLLTAYFHMATLGQTKLDRQTSHLGTPSNIGVALMGGYFKLLEECFSYSIKNGIIWPDGTTPTLCFVAPEEDKLLFRVWMSRIEIRSNVFYTDEFKMRAFQKIRRGFGEMYYFSMTEAANMSQRSIFLTEKGYMGVGPEGLCREDIICVLPGSAVPVAVRKENDHYVLVGQCYVEGLMSGEAVEGLERGKLVMQKLEIV